MSLADLLDINEENPACAGCNWYRGLSEEDQATFDSWVELWKSKRVVFRRIHDACKAYHYPMAEKALRDHINNHHVAR